MSLSETLTLQLTLYFFFLYHVTSVFPAVPLQPPSKAAECTPTTQPFLPSALTPPLSAALHAEVALQPTFSSSHPSYRSPRATGPLPVSAPSISHTQPQPQPLPHHLPSDKGPRVLQGSSQTLDETPQQLQLRNSVSSILPGSLWSRSSWGNLQLLIQMYFSPML